MMPVKSYPHAVVIAKKTVSIVAINKNMPRLEIIL